MKIFKKILGKIETKFVDRVIRSICLRTEEETIILPKEFLKYVLGVGEEFEYDIFGRTYCYGKLVIWK